MRSGPEFSVTPLTASHLSHAVFVFVWNRVEHDYYKYHTMQEVRTPDHYSHWNKPSHTHVLSVSLMRISASPQISKWMAQIQEQYSDVVETIHYGFTYELRTISLLKVQFNYQSVVTLRVFALEINLSLSFRLVCPLRRKRKLSGWTVVYTPGSGSPQPSASTLSNK